MYFMLPHSKALYIYMLFSSSFFLPLISSSSSSFLSFFYVVLAASYSAMIKLQCPFLLGEKRKKNVLRVFFLFGKMVETWEEQLLSDTCASHFCDKAAAHNLAEL